jgi:ribonuclease BN (tRNA processing enzyme)
MKLTVLGKSPAWQDAGGACSGYLVKDDERTVLLDCGNGVFGKLREYGDYVDVDAIIISHLHADHFLDLVPFAFGLTYAPRQQAEAIGKWPGTDSPARPVLYAPPGSREVFSHVCGLWGNCSLIEDAFDFREFDPAAEFAVGDLAFRFQEVPHYIQTWAIGVENGAGRRIAYGADCRPNEALCRFAEGADVLLAEATLPHPEEGGDRGHMTPFEAAQHAAEADVARLVLTHISDELDPAWAVGEASRAYGGPCEVAYEGMQIDL